MRLGPMLVAYKPVEISSLTLDKFHLGKTPPKIDGKILLCAMSLKYTTVFIPIY